jgi:hypothetical protein
MDFDKQLKLGHLLLNQRTCRVCGEVKDLISDFYRTRKDKGPVASSYSYECKDCTKRRIFNSRKDRNNVSKSEYPDW